MTDATPVADLQDAEPAVVTDTGGAPPPPATTDDTAKPAGDPPAGTTADGQTQAAKIEAKWRDDWREALASGDEEAMARLKRFQSVDGVFRSWKEMDKKLSSGQMKMVRLPDNPTEDDIAAYRKAWNVPDAVDGYEIKPPEGLNFSEPEQKSLNAFLADMHANHVPKGTVQKVAESYFNIRRQEEQEIYEAAIDRTTNQRAEIRAEYGRDYERNVRLGNDHLVKQLGPDKAKAIAAVTLADGTKLGDHPEFVRFIVGSALANADDGMLVTSEGGVNSGKSVDAQIEEIRALQFGNDDERRKFHSADVQARYTKLYEIKVRRQNAA